MKLIDTLRSGNAWKVRLLASLLGIRLERQTLSIDRGDLAQPRFLSIAPLGQVPVLELPDGSHLAESAAILFYLAQDSSWWPDGTVARARVIAWLSFEQEQHMKPLARLRLHLALHRRGDPASEPYLTWAKEARAALQRLDDQLQRQGDNGWVATQGAPSIADVALYPYTRMAPMGGITLAPYPAIQRWLERIEALAGYESLFPEDPSRTLSTLEAP